MKHAQASAPCRRRGREAVKRSRTVRFDLTEAEFGEIRDAAEQAGLARGAFAARAALVVLARQDGARPRFWNDYYRVGEACRSAEQRFGLRRTAPRDRTAGSRPTRAESEKARRRGRSEPPRITLRRAVSAAAAASSGEEEFFAHLEQAGVVVRKRFSTRNPGQVTGYAVALPTDTTRSGGPVWYSGGKLAPDLALPKLRHRWNGQAAGPAGGPAAPLTPAERAAIWDHVTRTAAGATEQIRQLSVTDPGLAADAAWAAADTFHAAASALGGSKHHRTRPPGTGRQGEDDLPNSSQTLERPHPAS
jgi:hypothetical protein